jgi:hypothetical protein
LLSGSFFWVIQSAAKNPGADPSLHPVLCAPGNEVTLKIRFPFPLRKGLGVRFFATPRSLDYWDAAKPKSVKTLARNSLPIYRTSWNPRVKKEIPVEGLQSSTRRVAQR